MELWIDELHYLRDEKKIGSVMLTSLAAEIAKPNTKQILLISARRKEGAPVS